MGTALLLEYEAVLGREDLFRTSGLQASEREELLDIFLAHCRWVRIFYGWRPNLPDEGDNHLVELAVAACNAAIVTRNLRDLQRMDLRFPDLRILRPRILSRFPVMSALTVRLPADKHARLRQLAKARGTTLNRLIDDMATLLLAEHDAETRFRLRAARGADQQERGLALLAKAEIRREQAGAQS